MELEKQVVSLDLSKKLRKLGVKQESYFYWRYDSSDSRIDTNPVIFSIGDYDVSRTVSAFTVAELGEVLPYQIGEGYLITGREDNRWFCDYETPISTTMNGGQFADTEANARAKMLIYLLENKLIQLS